jgi:hypothetical protein
VQEEGDAMSSSSKDEYEKLTSAIGDETIDSLAHSHDEVEFTADFHDTWKVTVGDAVRRMQSEKRTTDQHVQVAQTAARNILVGAYQHARRGGQPKSITASDIHVAIDQIAVAEQAEPSHVEFRLKQPQLDLSFGWPHVWPFNVRSPTQSGPHDLGSAS